MLKIGDFSQLAQVSVRTLRLYDELGLLKPAQVDRFTEYRYYAMEQLPRLNRILALKDLGLSLEQIARLLDDNLPAEQLRGMLLMKQAEMEQQLEEGQARLARVEARLKQIEQEGNASPYEAVLKNVEPQFIASMRQIVPTIEDMARIRCALYADLYDWLMEKHVKAGEPELAIYHNSEYTDENIDMEAAVAVEGAPPRTIARFNDEFVTLRELPAAETMASVIHHGRFPDVCYAIIALYGWVGANGYATAGAYREIHLFGRENDLVSIDSVLIEMQVPVERN